MIIFQANATTKTKGSSNVMRNLGTPQENFDVGIDKRLQHVRDTSLLCHTTKNQTSYIHKCIKRSQFEKDLLKYARPIGGAFAAYV
mgnify:CR=1 FL=1